MDHSNTEKATNVSYCVLSSEFDGVLIVAKRELNTYKLFICKKLFSSLDHKDYDPFITNNMIMFIEGVGNGLYRRFFDGYLVDRVIES